MPNHNHGENKISEHSGWQSFWRLLKFWRDFKGEVIASVILAAVMVVISLVIPTYMGHAVDHFKAEKYDKIYSDVAWILAAATLTALVGASRRVVAGRMSLGIEQHLRDKIFIHLSGLNFHFFAKQQTGQLIARTTSDVTAVRFFLGYGLTYLFVHASKIIAIPFALWMINPMLAGIVYVALPPILLVSIIYSRKAHPILRELRQRVALVTIHGEETIVGSKVVKAFGQEDREIKRFKGYTNSLVEQEKKSIELDSIYRPLFEFIPSIALVVVVYFAAIKIDSGVMTLGQLLAFYVYVLMLATPLRIVGNLLSRAQRATASSERLWELLDSDQRIDQSSSNEALPNRKQEGTEITFENVEFSYREDLNSDKEKAIKDITLRVPAGFTVAFIGPTGCGKTTLASLVPRFYDPDKGKITFDGVDVKDIRLKELRQAIGIVDQEPFLFSATIRENLSYGQPNASDDDLIVALKIAQAFEFVKDLPNGLDTIVGERGLTLSGGQRQRLAIARALVVNPRVLILDDATASVDSKIEERISSALQDTIYKRTTLIIAHRPSTIAIADLIVVMRDGSIEDQGTHDELIVRNEIYKNIYYQTKFSDQNSEQRKSYS